MPRLISRVVSAAQCGGEVKYAQILSKTGVKHRADRSVAGST